MKLKLKFWKKEPEYDKSNTTIDLPEEDGTAGLQNADEIEFNSKNPTYYKRIDNAKANLMKNISEEKKCDILYSIHIQESMEESLDHKFVDIDRKHER